MSDLSGHTGGNVERLELLDLYRGLSILLVLLFHYTSHQRIEFLKLTSSTIDISFGYLGVQAFFAISGFCIYLTMTRAHSATEFLAKRIARLWPALIACALITQLIVAWEGLPGREVSWGQWLASIFLLNDIGIPFIDGAYWSILIEVKYYVIFAIIYKYTKRPFEALVAFYLTTVFIACLLEPDYKVISSVVKIIAITKYFPWFILGAAFFLVYSRKRSLAVVAQAVAVVLLSVLAIEQQSQTEQLIALALVTITFALLLYYPAVQLPRWARYGGLISYPLYLVHQYVGFVVIRELAPLIESTEVKLLLATLAVVLIAHLVHITVEFRFRKNVESMAISLINRTKATLLSGVGILASR